MSWDLTIQNIAGIQAGTATLESGINAVRASNWQGKSSFVTAIETAMGTEQTLTEGADRGRVELSTDDATHTVELVRDGDTVRQEGTPYLSGEKQRVAAALYAFLDDTNQVRTAVRNHNNLESVLLRPLEFENIDKQIAERSAERERVETELEAAKQAAQKRRTLQSTVRQLEAELDNLKQKRASLVEDQSDGRSVDAKRRRLRELKTERDSVEDRIKRLRRTIDRTQEKLTDKRATLEELTMPESDEGLDSKIATHQEELTDLERDAELLQSVYAPTKRLIDEGRLDLITDIDHALTGDRITCWQCGSETTTADIERRLDNISDRITELRTRASEHENRIEELQQKRYEVKQQVRQKADLQTEITDLESKVEERKASLERARERRETLEANIEETAGGIEKKDDKLTDIESDIKFTRTKLVEKRGKLEELAEQAGRREMLEAEYDELTDEITSLRNRKDEMKRRTRESFDEAIRDVLSAFDVGFEMVRLTATYELVVARDGREASLSALSEGELELLGIVAALAGYEAFDVTEDLPIMILDGIGGLADDNVQRLIDYLAGRVDRLVFTTYPENTRFERNTIDPGEWTVVSPETKIKQK
jgi:DNA repair exonuclease SbcCD ATPase subunit